MIEQAVVAALADLADVYPAYLPERAGRPAITYRRISTVRDSNHDGPSGLATARVQITAHTDTHPEALSLANTIRERFHGHRGPLAPNATDSTHFVTVDNEIDLGYDDDSEGWNITLDTLIRFKE